MKSPDFLKEFSFQSIHEKTNIKPSLDSISFYYKILGKPLNTTKCIHVAGTNGKGSVCWKLFFLLKELNIRVGLYSSPHIFDFKERIRTHKGLIPHYDFVRLCKYLNHYIHIYNKPLSYFEFLTLIMFLFFEEQKLSFVILEAGLGGSWDATNIIRRTFLCIITTIDYDHTNILGSSLDEISREKSGIIKPSIPLILGPSLIKNKILLNQAKILKAPLYPVIGTYKNYDEENSAIATLASSFLKFPFSKNDLKKICNNKPPCRLQKIFTDPLIILDVSHNPSGIKKTMISLENIFPNKRIVSLVSFSKDKDISSCLKSLTQYSFKIISTQFENSSKLNDYDSDNDKITFLPQIKHALECALKITEQNNCILLISGSFYLIPHVTYELSKIKPEILFDLQNNNDLQSML